MHSQRREQVALPVVKDLLREDIIMRNRQERGLQPGTRPEMSHPPGSAAIAVPR